MARAHVWQYLINREGQPIEGATVQVYLAGSETQATIYHQEDGGSPDAVGQVVTLSNGFFEFWIADLQEDGGYDSSQKIKIAWDKAGISKGHIDYVDVFDESLDYYPVDVKDNSQTKDRVVSNYYANIWTEHVTGTSYNEGAHNIYSIVDGSIDTIRNKLVSDNHLNTLNLNTEFLSASIDNLTVDGSYLTAYTAFLSAAIDANTQSIIDMMPLSSSVYSLELNTDFLSAAIDANNYDINVLSVSAIILQNEIESVQVNVDNILYYTWPTSAIDYPTHSETPSLSSVQAYFDHVMSSTPLSGFDLIDNGNGTVTISAGNALLRTGLDIYTTSLEEFSVPSGTTGIGGISSLVDNIPNYLFADWNMGTTRITCETSVPVEAGYTKVPIWIVNRIENTLHIVDMREYGLNYQANNSRKDFFVNGYEHQPGGTVLTEGTSALRLNLTAGIFYLANIKRTHPSFDTSAADTFTTLYMSGGDWVRTPSQTDIDVNYFDVGTGTLSAMTAGYYGVHWIYLIIGTSSSLYSVYGQDQYATLTDAQVAEIPGILPPEATGVGSQLVGKVIYLQGASNITEIQSPFSQLLQSSTPVLHNGLGSIQGGGPGEYYHLTQSELLDVQSLSGNAITITSFDESADTSCYVAYFNSPEGIQQIHTGTNLTFNSAAGILTTTTFTGDLVGNSSTATTLETARTIGGIQFDGSHDITVESASAGFATTGDITATGNITAYFSDMRLKNKIGNIENALDMISTLNGFYYTANSIAKSYGYMSDDIEVGISAQEVKLILPQVVKPAPFDINRDAELGYISSKSGENYMTVQYEKLVPLLIEAIKELNNKIKILESKLG
jgi:hypothetical protein